MEYIFVDTCIFESNNFLESETIKQILKMSEEGYIQIVLPEITLMEIKNRGTHSIKSSVENFVKSRNELRVLRNLPSIEDKLSPIDVAKCLAEFHSILDAVILKSKCLILPYPVVNIKEVFDKYFKFELPFQDIKEKKHEFPDAFALLTLEVWCKENKKKCYVFSNDKGVLDYENENLIAIKDYKEYIDKRIREIEVLKHRENRLKKAEDIYDSKKHELEREIESWLDDQLYNEYTYLELAHLDIIEIDVKKIDIELKDFQIISSTEYDIYIEVYALAAFEVVLLIPDESTGYYDSEDKVWNYSDVEYYNVVEEKVIPVLLHIAVPQMGDQYMDDISIGTINNNKDLKI